MRPREKTLPMMALGALDKEVLIAGAVTATGFADFGDPSWSEGLDRLLHALIAEARLNELGEQVAAVEITDYLSRRLCITDYRKAHPEITLNNVVPPIVIIGQARTGTTVLYDLLAQDPATRAPLTWEVDRPCPPPETDTYASDPRIAEIDELQSSIELLIPGFSQMHPIGAHLAQECVRMTAANFASLIFATQYRVPSYARWLINEADLAPTYRWHREYLQHLQARHRGGRWLLKSPAHLWHLPSLLAEYPNALLIQTHRDPLKIIASVSSLQATLRALASDNPDLPEIAAEWADYAIEGLDRSVTARKDRMIHAEQVVDVQFSELLDDPFEVIGRIYDQFGMDLTEEAEMRMRAFHADQPHAAPGAHRYTFADTQLEEGPLRERARRYQEYFEVPNESLIS